MFNLISLYIFLSSILIGLGLKYLLDFFYIKFNKNKFIYPIFLSVLLITDLLYIIPTSLTYNNNPLAIMNLSILGIFILKGIDLLESKKDRLSENIENNIDINDKEKGFFISDLLITILGSSVYILYIISLFIFNLSFFENISLGMIIELLIINGLLMSIFFIFSRNSIKYNLIGLLIILIIGAIEIFIFTQTKAITYFLPNISYILQSFLGFISLYYIIDRLYTKKYIDNIFIVSFLILFIIGNIIL